MSTAVVATPETLADLVDSLGNVPLQRVRLQPPPGTATETDLLADPDGSKRLCELVDGVLVEKAVGFYESRLAMVLALFLETFLEKNNLAIVVGPDAHMALQPGLVRMPDVSILLRERLPDGKTPHESIAALAPDLAVEIMSPSNTRKEMDRKLREYFAAGVQLVWYVYPETKTVRVYSSVDDSVLLTEDDTLTGGDVLTGFSLSVRAWFKRAE